MRSRNFLIYFITSLYLCFTLLQAAAAADTKEERLGIYSDGKKIGNSYVSIGRNEDGQTEVTEKTRLRVNLLENEDDVQTEAYYILSGYVIESFQFELKSEATSIAVKGEREDGMLKITLSDSSESTDILIENSDDLILSSLHPKWLAAQGLETGKRYDTYLFDPINILFGTDRENYRSEHKVEGPDAIAGKDGNKVDTYRISSVYQGNQYTTWLTKNGEIVKQTIPPDLIAHRESPAEASRAIRDSVDLAGRTSIPSKVKLSNARELKQMSVSITGSVLGEDADLTDGLRQFYQNGALTIRAEDLSGLQLYDLPFRRDIGQEYINPTILIQSTDEDIVEITNRVVDGEKNPLEAARKINEWVYKNLKKQGTVGIPSAREVLRTRTGDCNEHATLFTAMARAAGIPARIALGVIYIDGSFYYHAWNEIYAGKWISVDPSFGQMPADAAHIKFIEGDLTQSSHIMKLVGNINIEILDAF